MTDGVYAVWDDKEAGTIDVCEPATDRQTDITYWGTPSCKTDAEIPDEVLLVRKMQRTGFKNDLSILREKMDKDLKRWNLY